MDKYLANHRQKNARLSHFTAFWTIQTVSSQLHRFWLQTMNTIWSPSTCRDMDSGIVLYGDLFSLLLFEDNFFFIQFLCSSHIPTGMYSPKMMLFCIRRLIKYLQINNVILLSHSYGCNLNLLVCLIYNNPHISLVL